MLWLNHDHHAGSWKTIRTQSITLTPHHSILSPANFVFLSPSGQYFFYHPSPYFFYHPSQYFFYHPSPYFLPFALIPPSRRKPLQCIAMCQINITWEPIWNPKTPFARFSLQICTDASALFCFESFKSFQITGFPFANVHHFCPTTNARNKTFFFIRSVPLLSEKCDQYMGKEVPRIRKQK